MRIDEKVLVNLWGKGPTDFVWRQKRIKISQVGLHHTRREGRDLIHVFSVVAEGQFYRLEMSSESLNWKLKEVESGETN